VKASRAKGPKVEALLRDARPIKWSDTELELGFPYQFHRDQIDQPENRAIVEACVAEITGKEIRIRCVHATKEEIRALNGTGPSDEDDAFVDEVERLLRGVHARKLKTSRTVT
jgi:archaeosine-15-forming tRNA-guanine transglycosylase